jgi:hypothetical protein
MNAIRSVFTIAFCLALMGQTADVVPPQVAPLSSLQRMAVPLLTSAIVESRDAALREGVAGVPRAVRAALQNYVAGTTLDRVRWRVGGSDVLSLQRGLIGFGYAPAVTLDHVIVFESAADARDPKLWVHELRHVEQFAAWGVAGFAERYIANHAGIETDAAEYRWTWMKITNRTPPP